MKRNMLIVAFTGMAFFLLGSCKKYLDVVPDNMPTLNNAFALRAQAQKFLYTLYSYMPHNGDPASDPAMLGGDELWRIDSRVGVSDYINMAKGTQNKVSPYGDANWINLYRGIRECNIFLENIDHVPDMEEYEKLRWIAEAKFLKAYYHYYLLKMYGPIPLVKENLPIDAGVNEVKVFRQPVDECFNYIVQLINEATPYLPLTIQDPLQELGRITLPIALSLKAEVLVTAASPLFNGNTDQATLKNPDGTPLFNTTFSKLKWDSAAVACKKAIDICQSAGIILYEQAPNYQQYTLSETIRHQLSIRNAVALKWNSEIIWANTQSLTNGIQGVAFPLMDSRYPENFVPRGEYSPTLKIAEMFYSKNGVPINEDKDYDYNNRYRLRIATANDQLLIRKDYTTAYLHFDREPRFYADLGFDGGVWYGQGVYDDKTPANFFYVQAKRTQPNAIQTDRSTATGYFLKKLINFENVVGSGTAYTINNYPMPLIRLSELYLFYAEALNESQGPGAEVYAYINLIRNRAGLQSVETSWTAHSSNPGKYLTQGGLRDIIHQERLIELCFEGKRFWDLRRWKESTKLLNGPIQGWDGSQGTAAAYYTPITLFNQTFGTKDYFWPINDFNVLINRNLVQNLGW
jgi:hypothetical protein